MASPGNTVLCPPASSGLFEPICRLNGTQQCLDYNTFTMNSDVPYCGGCAECDARNNPVIADGKCVCPSGFMATCNPDTMSVFCLDYINADYSDTNGCNNGLCDCIKCKQIGGQWQIVSKPGFTATCPISGYTARCIGSIPGCFKYNGPSLPANFFEYTAFCTSSSSGSLSFTPQFKPSSLVSSRILYTPNTYYSKRKQFNNQ